MSRKIGGLGLSGGILLALAAGCGVGVTGSDLLPLTADSVIDTAPQPLGFAPEVHPESYSAARNTVLDIPAADGVLGNDRFVESLEAYAGLTEAGGFIELTLTGAIRYVPPIDYVGADHFTYRVSNPNGTSTSRVLLKVLAPEDVPVP